MQNIAADNQLRAKGHSMFGHVQHIPLSQSWIQLPNDNLKSQSRGNAVNGAPQHAPEVELGPALGLGQVHRRPSR